MAWSRGKTNSVFLTLNDLTARGECWQLWMSRSQTLSSLSVKKITNRGVVLLVDLSPGDGRMVCGIWAFTHCYSSTGRDEWLGGKKKKKTDTRMSQPRATLSLCICANQGPDDSWAKSWQFLLKNKMYGRQNLENSGFILGLDSVQVKNTQLWCHHSCQSAGGTKVYDFEFKMQHQRRIVRWCQGYASGGNKSNKLCRNWQPNIFLIFEMHLEQPLLWIWWCRDVVCQCKSNSEPR